jgi:hypothetical protein
MVDRLKKLTLKTKLTFYVCQPNSGKMYTIHEGKSFEGDLPEWLAKFVAGDEPLLPFDQDGEQKTYVRWVLNVENTVIYLDDAKLSGLMLLLNNLVAQSHIPKPEEASAVEIRILKEKLQQLKLGYETELDEARQQITALREANVEQAVHLQEAIKAKENTLDIETMPPAINEQATNIGGESADAISQLQEKNERLEALVKDWEERYKKLEYSTLPPPEDNIGIAPVISALNKVILTKDASALNLDMLNLIVSTPSQEELETNPDMVRSVIAKLISMERSGQLSIFLMKKLNNVVRANAKGA